jgi:deoxyinosine 3'endonuclease (endonuclease V)
MSCGCREQLELARRVVRADDNDWMTAEGLQLVGGLDISFHPSDAEDQSTASATLSHRPPASAPDAVPVQGDASASAVQSDACYDSESAGRAVAALAVMSFPELELTHLELLDVDLNVPYLSGLLGFR